MKKYLIPIIVFLSFISFVSAAETIKSGVLQAFWLPVWVDSNTNKPVLELRFFTFNSAGKVDKVIDLDSDKLNVKFIKDKFNKIPSDFFEFKEGHIEQSGVLSFKNFKTITECNSKIYKASYVMFTPNDKAFTINADTDGCDAYPYILTYQMKGDAKNIILRDKPESGAKSVALLSASDTLIKIKTVNPDWYYVADYDDTKANLIGNMKGYVKSSDVAPVN